MIDADTRDASYFIRPEHVSGSIETGKRTDLIVFSRNLFKLPTYEPSDAVVEMTLPGGLQIYPTTLPSKH